MTEVNRWRRYGHDRLYVTGADGEKLGYFDLKTQEFAQVPETQKDDIYRAVSSWLKENQDSTLPLTTKESLPSEDISHTAQPIPQSISTPRKPENVEAAWSDLAANRPGQAAAEVAAAHRSARPITSRLEPLFGIHSDAQAWRKGVAGEEATAKALRKLTHPFRKKVSRQHADWYALHAIPIGSRGADVDHLIIGPTGVFTINSKRHDGKTVWVGDKIITVNRHSVSYTYKAISEARRVSNILNLCLDGIVVEAIPVISVVGAVVTGRTYTQDNVLVASAKDLPRLLPQIRAKLSMQEVHEIYEVARRSTTWKDR